MKWLLAALSLLALGACTRARVVSVGDLPERAAASSEAPPDVSASNTAQPVMQPAAAPAQRPAAGGPSVVAAGAGSPAKGGSTGAAHVDAGGHWPDPDDSDDDPDDDEDDDERDAGLDDDD